MLSRTATLLFWLLRSTLRRRSRNDQTTTDQARLDRVERKLRRCRTLKPSLHAVFSQPCAQIAEVLECVASVARNAKTLEGLRQSFPSRNPNHLTSQIFPSITTFEGKERLSFSPTQLRR